MYTGMRTRSISVEASTIGQGRPRKLRRPVWIGRYLAWPVRVMGWALEWRKGRKLMERGFWKGGWLQSAFDCRFAKLDENTRPVCVMDQLCVYDRDIFEMILTIDG